MAMIAALPKAPSRVNPINHPEAAIARRNYVLGRMYSLGYIDADVYNKALAEPDEAILHTIQVDVKAPYLAEMVRDEMVQRYGEDAYTSGFEVVTTIESSLQNMANRALRDTLLDYPPARLSGTGGTCRSGGRWRHCRARITDQLSGLG